MPRGYNKKQNKIYLGISFFIISLVLVCLVFSMGQAFRKKLLYDLEKGSPFECGFSPKFNARIPFSMRFFLICLIFLVFDVELVLIFPFIPGMGIGRLDIIQVIVSVFLAILLLGVWHEWNQGSLDWAH